MRAPRMILSTAHCSPPTAHFLLMVAFEYVRDVCARRRKIYARDKLVCGELLVSGGDFIPLRSTARPRVVCGDDARLRAGSVSIVARNLLQIPTADLYVSLGVA